MAQWVFYLGYIFRALLDIGPYRGLDIYPGGNSLRILFGYRKPGEQVGVGDRWTGYFSLLGYVLTIGKFYRG